MTDEERRGFEAETKRLAGDTLSLAAGQGVRLTNDEARIVFRVLGDALSRATNETVVHDIGTPEDVDLAAALYVRLGTAMPSK